MSRQLVGLSSGVSVGVGRVKAEAEKCQRCLLEHLGRSSRLAQQAAAGLVSGQSSAGARDCLFLSTLRGWNGVVLALQKTLRFLARSTQPPNNTILFKRLLLVQLPLSCRVLESCLRWLAPTYATRPKERLKPSLSLPQRLRSWPITGQCISSLYRARCSMSFLQMAKELSHLQFETYNRPEQPPGGDIRSSCRL